MFVFRRFLRLFPAMSASPGMKVLGWVLAAAFGGAFILFSRSIWSTGIVVTLYFLLACLALQIVHIFYKNQTFYGLTWVIAGALTALVLLLGWWNMHTIHEKDYVVETTKLERDVTVAFISDLHLGLNMDAGKLGEYLDKISAAKPDLLLLGGDIFDESTTKEDMEKACLLLGRVDAKYGVYYVYGNHDSGRYRAGRPYTEEEMTRSLTAAGVHVLADEKADFDNGVTLIGLEDRSRRTADRTAELLTDRSRYNIVLDHQPVDLQEKADAGADLDQSGHTHGGQVWPLGIFNEYWSTNDYNYGLRTYGDMTSIVSSGIAGWGYSVRTQKQCEYLMITIRVLREGG
ncbi:MAG: metallophosphoesterase [Lachnospiraceae bacterium]|nr:metallophosphoesterase [Lachnospiraceae bacterium]